MEWSLVVSAVFLALALALLGQCRAFQRQGQAAHDAALQRYREARAMLRQAEQLHAEAVRAGAQGGSRPRPA